MRTRTALKRVAFSLSFLVVFILTPLDLFSAELTASQRQDRVKTGFQKGKSLYDSGRYEEAFAQWDEITPYLEPGSSVQKVIDFLKKRSGKPAAPSTVLQPKKFSQGVPEPKKAAPAPTPVPAPVPVPAPTPVPAPAPKKVEPAPKELPDLLVRASAKLEQDAKEVEARKSLAKSADAERSAGRARVLAAVEKGKTYYYAGDIAKALDQWESIASEFEDGARVESLIRDARGAQERLEAARSSSTASSAAPAGVDSSQLSSLLKDAGRKLGEEIEAAEAERAAAERKSQRGVQESRVVATAFKNGKAAYEAGRYDEALTAWEKLRDSESAPAGFAELLDGFKAGAAKLERARRAAATPALSVSSTGPVVSPAEMERFFSTASQRFESEYALAAAARKRAEAGNSGARATAGDAFERGRLLYYQGLYDEALAEWEALLPQVADSAPLRATIQGLKEKRQQLREAEKETERLSRAGLVKPAAPDELPKLLEQAEKKIQNEIWRLQSAKTRAAEERESRQAGIRSQASEARDLFEKGRTDEAIARWEALLPLLDDPSVFAAKLSALKLQANNAALLKKSAAELESSKKDASLPGDEVISYVEQAKRRLDEEVLARETERRRVNEAILGRQKAVDAAFEAGKKLYGLGRYDEAIAEWDKLLPFLDPESRSRLESLEKSYEASRRAKREAEAASSAAENLQVPADLEAVLESASQRLAVELTDAKKKQSEAERTFESRQGAMLAAYEKGKTFFADGRYAEAAREWDKLSSYDKRFAAPLQTLKRSAEEASAARQAADRVSAESRSRVQISADQIAAALGEAAVAMNAEGTRATQALAAAEKEDRARQDAMLAVYEKGRAFFAAGRYSEAAREWDKLSASDPRFAAKLKDLKATADETAAARQAAERYTSESYSRMKVSADEMLQTLSAAESEMQAQSAKALEQRSQLEKSVTERQAWVLSTFEEGRKLYDSGKREQALELWSSITPYLQEEAAVKGSLRRVAASIGAAREASRAAEDAASRQNVKLKAPADLTKILSDAEVSIEKETERALAARQLSEKTASDRQRTLEDTLARAKQDYAQGKIEDALKKWGTALPGLEAGKELRPALDRLEAAVRERGRALQALASAEEKKAAKIRAPAELEAVFGEASRKMNTEAQSVDLRAKEIEGELADRQVWITFTFQDGRKLYEAGKFDEALKVWGTLVPYLENGAQVQTLLDGIRKDKELFEQAKKTAAGAAARKDAKFRTPPPLPQLLQELSGRLAKDAAAAKAEEALSLESVGQQQAAVEAAFGRGKTNFTAGLYEEALREWETLVPYLQEGPELGRSIQDARGKLAQTLEAKRLAAEAAAGREAKVKAPSDLTKLLAETETRLLQDKKNAVDEKAKLEKARLDRQAWMDATFLAGRDAYTQGRYHEALAEWDKLAVHIDPKAGIREALDRARKSHEQALDAKKDVVQFAAKEYKESRVPEGMEQLLKEADARLKEDVRRFQAEKGDAQKTLAERRARLQAASNRAKAYYAEGRLPEAVKEWQGMAADFDPASPEAKLIASLPDGLAARAQASQFAAEASALKAAPVTLAPETLLILTEAQKKIYQETSLFLARKQDAEKALEARQTAVAVALERAKLAATSGKLEEAFSEWEKLAPEFAAGDALRAEIQKARQGLAEAAAARTAAEAAERAAGGRLKTPEGLTVRLAQARLDIKNQTTTAQAQTKKWQDGRAALEVRAAATFDRTKALLQAGRAEEALREWAGVQDLVESSPALDESIATLRAALDENVKARQALAAASEEEKKKVSVPADFAATLVTAMTKMQEETRAAAAQRAQMEKALADRRAWANSVYQKGRALYGEGKYAEAVAQWEELLSKSEEAAALKPSLDQLKARLSEAAEARKSAGDFAANEYRQLRIPLDELGKQLEDADVKLRKEIEQAGAQKAEMQKTLAERQAWVADTFAKGKALLAEGRVREALEVWNSLTPYLADESKMKDLLARVSAKNEQAAEARRQADAAAAALAGKFKAPAEFTPALADADQKLLAAAQAANGEKAKADKALEEKKVWVKFTFEDGKNLYAAGKVAEALQLWGTLVPHLENGEAVKAAFEKVTQSQAAAAKARAESLAALEQQDQKFAVPQDLSGLLMAASEKLSQDVSSSLAQKGKADQITAERQRWIESAFADGKNFYDQGRYPEAIKEWVSIVPYLQDEEELKALMEKVSALHTELRSARAAAEEAQGKEGQRSEAPPELYKLLEEAGQTLHAETERLVIQREGAKKTLAERQAVVSEAFQRGRSQYQSGQVLAAIEEWRLMLPHLAEEAKIAAMLKDLGQSETASEKARAEAKDALSRQNVRLEMPVELFPFLQRANDALKAEALEAQTQKSKAEGNLQERQQWITTTFQQGKIYYDQGQYKEAADEWAKLAPYTDEASGIRELIESVRQSQRQTLQAKTAAVEAVAGEYKGLKLAYSEQMVQLLERANQKMKEEAQASLRKKEETEAAVAERREWSTTTFNKGKIFYEQDRFDEAIDQWSRLVPYLDGDSRARQLIETIKANHEAFLAARRDAEAQTGQKPSYEAMSAFFEQAAKKLASETQNAKIQGAAAERQFAKRKEWIETTFRKGKEYFDQARYTEALREWDILRPYLAEAPELQKEVDEARRRAEEAVKALPAAASAAAKLQAVAALPQAAAPSRPEAAEPQEDSDAPADEEVVEEEAAPSAPEPAANKASEFVSGEVTAVDPAEMTLTMKLYTVNKDRNLKIRFDESTKIDGGAQNTEALASGVAIDLRYDPQTNKALYIYIY